MLELARDLGHLLPTIHARAACAPAVETAVDATRRPDGMVAALQVTTNVTDDLDDTYLTAIELQRAQNTRVEVNGQAVAVPSTIVLPPSTESWGFVALRLNPSTTFQLDYVVRDTCGEVARFVGAGTGTAYAASTPSPTPSPQPTSTATATAKPTQTATPRTATPQPTSAPPTPTASPQPPAVVNPGGQVTPGSARLTATFNSIGIELPFTGDPNGNATASVEFRPAGSGSWRAGLPLWRTADAAGPAFYGSALFLAAGQSHDVRITVTDPDGIVGSAVQTVTTATRADAIPASESLTPTHFVRTTGNDAADGRTPSTAWRTYDKAVRDAPSGAVVQVGPGYYATQQGLSWKASTARSTPLTLVAQYPAVDDQRRPTSAGQRSVIEPVGVSSPAGTTDGPNPGVWRRVTLTGPKTGGQYAVWQWPGSPVTDATQLGHAPARADAPVRVASWKRDAGDLATPAGWAEKLYTNLTYRYGFYSTGNDLYLWLPGDADPNTRYITASGANHIGLGINGPNVRLSGFEVRQFTRGILALAGAQNAIVDRNLLTGNAAGVAFQATVGAAGADGVRPIYYGSDHVVQENLIQDSSLWSTRQADGATVPWNFIKSKIRNANGSDYAVSRVGAASETNGVQGAGGAKRVIVRRNTIDGTFNGVGTSSDGFDRYGGQDMDVHDNLIRHIADDALEPERATINFRAWGNRIEESLTVLSTGPVTFGPVYLVRNVGWRTGNDGVGRDGQGRVPSPTIFKYSGTSTPNARIFVLHNTFWTDRAAVTGGGLYASAGASPEAFYLRNNVMRTTRYAFEAPEANGAWDEDGNQFATVDPARGLEYGSTVYTSDVQAYRVASRQGARTNVASGFTTDIALVNPAAGDVSLAAGSVLVDAGLLVPNVSDRAGVDFQGAAPDLGATTR